MSDLLASIARHGYLALAVVVFLEAVGLPVPAAVGLLAAGAAAALHKLRPDVAFAAALLAMVLGDLLMFLLGRYTGWKFLGFLCRLAANPESCVLSSADSFYRRGRLTLVIAKFIPAINTMAPPLAGSMRMRAAEFLALDALGTALYVLAFGAAGYVFSDFLEAITSGMHLAGRAVGWTLVAAMAGYAAYHLVLFWKHRVYRIVPRVQAGELAQRLADPAEAERIMIADVRSHGYYDPGAERIRGSIRLEPNHLRPAMEALPKDKLIFLYCT